MVYLWADSIYEYIYSMVYLWVDDPGELSDKNHNVSPRGCVLLSQTYVKK